MITKIKILGILIGIFAFSNFLKQNKSDLKHNWIGLQAERFLGWMIHIQRNCWLSDNGCILWSYRKLCRYPKAFPLWRYSVHAILPGIAVGFIWSGTKDNYSILSGYD